MGNQADVMLRLENQLCFAVHSAAHAFARAYKPLLDPLDLTYPQYLVLLRLWEQDGQTVSELGAPLFLDSGTLTPLLKRIEKAGLVTRSRDKIDERQVRVVLTPKGDALREKARGFPHAMGCLTGLDEAQALSLRKALTGIGASLRG
jgi:MarR family transcriptional regulator, organic hydroperoxide resistance regulator